MSHCEVTLSANAGIALRLGEIRLWVDMPHVEKVPGFSTFSKAQWQRILTHPEFASPDLILYTHCHPDHYSKELAGRTKERWPQAQLILPQQEFDGQVLLSGQRVFLNISGLHMEFCRLTHEGERFADVPNYGCFLCGGGFSVLIAGDCAVADPALADFIGERKIDLAFLNFPWVALQRGRAFIERSIHPEHLIVYHLPFAEDNRWGFREAAAKGAARLPGIPDLRILDNPMQTEVF